MNGFIVAGIDALMWETYMLKQRMELEHKLWEAVRK